MSLPAPIWTPSDERARASRICDFAAFARSYGAPGDLALTGPMAGEGYRALHRWSIDEPAHFWTAVWKYTGIVSEHGPTPDDVPALDWPAAHDAGAGSPGFGPGQRPRWFPGARLNFAENLLQAPDDELALVAWGEQGLRTRLTFGELRQQVAAFSQALRQSGVDVGDRVAAVVPNGVEAIVAFLGAASIGAVWSSCSPEFGTAAVVDRFGQIAPRVLILTDAVQYRGKSIDLRERGTEIAAALPSVEHVVHVAGEGAEPTAQGEARHWSWGRFVASGGDAATPSYLALPFEHPLAILYSSGTTGLPKAIVHSAGGTLLQHRKEHVLHGDLRAGDRLFYFTTCGWMMWNWLVTGLAEGAVLVLYDGSPVARPDVLWQLADEERVTHFGASARYFALMESEGVHPATAYDLSALRCVFSTGSPLSPASFRWIYREVSPDLHLASISGGTDIVSCFALGNPAAPVYEGELQAPGLGMAVEIHAPGGAKRPLPAGVAGELTCVRPFPSMPIGFWNDPGDQRFTAAYFERSPGVWSHGDWAEMTPSGGLIIHGRSDATLNPGGVRVGTAEIYRPLDAISDVIDAVAVGQPRPGGAGAGDVQIVLFVVLREHAVLDAELESTIRRRIRAEASPHHVPARIVAVPDLPRTLSGKLSELAVRDVLLGRPVTQREALANPESIDMLARLVAVRLPDPVVALVGGIVDYAGLFPPAKLPMSEAVAEYAARLEGPERALLGRFVVPVPRLDELADAAQASDGHALWQLSALVADDPVSDAAQIAEFHAAHAGWARVDAIEARVATPDDVTRVAEAFADTSIELWLEVAQPANAAGLLAAMRAVGAGAKVRTGAVVAEGFPAPEHLLTFIEACVTEGVRFKATAGLHHPLRGEYRLTYDDEPDFTVMYGYLNLLLATAVIRAKGARSDALEALLETDPASISADAEHLRWRSFEVSLEAIAALRNEAFASFGSCSFAEPVEELGALLDLTPAL
jgi:acetoacetyl-CoA synthetase